jgi:hypothetical protein
MEPGKDFAELGYKADFTAKPSFWVYNQWSSQNPLAASFQRCPRVSPGCRPPLLSVCD